MKIKVLIFCFSLILFSCHDDGGGEQPPEKDDTATSFQVLTLFAPGQLGDRGYADNVLSGVNDLFYPIELMGTSTLDSRFIAPFDFDDARQSLKEWVVAPANPFQDGDYDRRLLIITEPYMVSLLDDIKDNLRPADEVLLLKVNEDDVNDVATRYGLGRRVHGLNISAAPAIRKFCAHLNLWITEMEEVYEMPVHMDYLPIYRLYSDEVVNYRDSVFEVLAEGLADRTTVVTEPVSDLKEPGTSLTGTPVIEMAYELANMFGRSADRVAIVDLGAGNAGWDYWLLGNSNYDRFITLMLDAQENGYYRYNILRRFDSALYTLVCDWITDSIGALPAQTTLSDEWYCDDNLDTDDEEYYEDEYDEEEE